MSFRIGCCRRSSDEIQDLDCFRLGHHLHNIVKLGLAEGNSFKAELRFGLNQPGFNVIRPEGRKLDSDGGKQVGGRAAGIFSASLMTAGSPGLVLTYVNCAIKIPSAIL